MFDYKISRHCHIIKPVTQVILVPLFKTPNAMLECKPLSQSSVKIQDKNVKVLIKSGPVLDLEETSQKELEDYFENRHEWKTVENGGVLRITVEDFGMVDLKK